MVEAGAGKPRVSYSPDKYEAMCPKTIYFKKGKTVTFRLTNRERF